MEAFNSILLDLPVELMLTRRHVAHISVSHALSIRLQVANGTCRLRCLIVLVTLQGCTDSQEEIWFMVWAGMDMGACSRKTIFMTLHQDCTLAPCTTELG